MTAIERYNANMEGEIEPDPIERLRFFLSLAITGQDWLDVEQFIDGVSNQLASREAEVAELREQVKQMRDKGYAGVHMWLGDMHIERVLTEREIAYERISGNTIANAAKYCLEALTKGEKKE